MGVYMTAFSCTDVCATFSCNGVCKIAFSCNGRCKTLSQENSVRLLSHAMVRLLSHAGASLREEQEQHGCYISACKALSSVEYGLMRWQIRSRLIFHIIKV